MAGKGDRNRLTDRSHYRSEHDRIFGQRRRLRGGCKVFVNGHWIDPDNISAEDAAAMRKRDATNMESIMSGVNPDQAAEFNRMYAGSGAVASGVTGNVTYKDRNSKLKHLKQRGLHDMNESRG